MKNKTGALTKLCHQKQTALQTFLLVSFIVFLNLSESFSQCQQLVWQDEFDGTSLDLSKWSYQTGNGTNDGLAVGWGNSELQYYTSRTQNVKVQNGNLEITAIAENYLGANYTSGRIRSTNPITNNPRNEWTYGSFEARIQLPAPYFDSRAWPGFWMLPHDGPWPNTGEIDIMETGLNNMPWAYNGTLHYFSGAHQQTGTGPVTVNTSPPCPGPNGDMSTCFHIYRVDWAPGSIKFFVDGVQIGSTLTPASTVNNAWPFDPSGNNFHILLNMAVGGWFPGTPVNNARFPLTMLVDYVKVYSNPSAINITGKTKVMQGDNGITYSVTAAAGSSFNWSVPSGATIASGQGTNSITVNYGSSAVSGNVSVVITPSGSGCVPVTANLAVAVLQNTCTLTLEDFEAGTTPPTRNLGFNFSTGWMNRSCSNCQAFPYGTYSNPGAGGSNTSVNIGKYERNGGVQYDVVAYNDIAIGDASNFKNGITTFSMDVRTDAPAGTTVMVQLENRQNAQTGYPNGLYARFTATTGAPNTWNKLNFTLLDTPDGSMDPSEVDQIVLFFNPNSYTSHTYYFDNFKRVGSTPTTSAITGPASVCQNNTGLIYSVTATSGSKYTWTVPTGASIVSGQGTNSITVNFGSNAGNVTVTESNSVNCSGTTKVQAVTISGPCNLAAEFSGNPLSTCIGSTVTFTDLTTGKTGGEIYSWDFGVGASLPSGTSGAGPHKVNYSSAGNKKVTLTVSNGTTSTKIKNNYVSIAPAPNGCLFSDDYNDNTVKWITPIPGAFSHSETGTSWNISNAGYTEWDNFLYTLNSEGAAAPLNFSCSVNKPTVYIKAKASDKALLRVAMVDANGLATDNVPTYNLELTNSYKTFTINYSGSLRNYYSSTPGFLDSTKISKLQFFINPGYVSYPYVGVNKTYNSAFNGTVNIDYIGIGDNSCATSLPVNFVEFDLTSVNDNSVLLNWSTASEINNDYFEIMRSSDGIYFTSLEVVEGQGNENIHSNYYFRDLYLPSGIYYYYIKQVDKDGKSTATEIKSINVSQSISFIEVIPTVVGNSERIKIQNHSNQEVSISMLDINGKTSLDGFKIEAHGNQELESTGLKAGVYFIKALTNEGIEIKKIFIQ